VRGGEKGKKGGKKESYLAFDVYSAAFRFGKEGGRRQGIKKLSTTKRERGCPTSLPRRVKGFLVRLEKGGGGFESYGRLDRGKQNTVLMEKGFMEKGLANFCPEKEKERPRVIV